MAASRPKLIGVRIDLETKSNVNIKHGVYRYCEDPDFEVLLCSYSLIWRYPGGKEKQGKVRLLDLDDQTKCTKFTAMLRDESFQKHAFNAQFERIALSKWLNMPNGVYLDPVNWWCSAVRANVHGVFGTLDEVARAVRSPIAKDPEGKRLIKFFSIPMTAKEQKAADATCGCQKFHRPTEHPAEFAHYARYNIQDVVTEAMVASQFPTPSNDVQAEYEADQRINDRGIRHFRGLSEQAVAQVEIERDRLMGELKDLTGLDNPNSVQQIQRWLTEHEYPMTSLAKDFREEALADPTVPDEVAEVLQLKGAASLSSVAKHKAALETRCADGRIRGSLRFYGAHTGREAGRGIQPQNLPRYEAPREDRALLLRGLAGPEAPRIAKGTVRASLVPAKGHVFVTADYNAIEARVLAGLAGEQWALDEFRNEGKIYEATAAQMFGVDKAQMVAALGVCGKCGSCQWCAHRDKGKVSNLALGYAGGAGALVTMGAESAGIDIGNYKELHREWEAEGKPGKFFQWNPEAHDYPELLRLRDLYRDKSPMTQRFWKLCAKAWDVAAVNGTGARFGNQEVLTMIRDGRHNRMILPSGRSIWYRFARSIPTAHDPDKIDYRIFTGKGMGVGHVRTETHGGKLTENVVQAVARDVLFDLIMKIEAMTAAGWPGRIVLHVHDEVVLEVPERHAQRVLDDVLEMMSIPPEWGKDFLIVKGAGDIMERYRK